VVIHSKAVKRFFQRIKKSCRLERALRLIFDLSPPRNDKSALGHSTASTQLGVHATPDIAAATTTSTGLGNIAQLYILQDEAQINGPGSPFDRLDAVNSEIV